MRKLALSAVLLVVVSFFVGIATSFPPAVSALTPGESITGNASFDAAQMQEYYSATRDCSVPSLECLVFNVTRYIAIELSRTICTETNVDPVTTDDYGRLPTGTPIANRPASFMQGMGFAIGTMYQYPIANTRTYVADVLNSARISTPAYAQGVGFAALDPVLDLWKTFRNVAYMFFVVLFILIGFMIMFRAKISGQTVVTAQQAIPSIIISLILVTFSYAIGGFMIDLMYLFMFMIVGLFGQTFQNNPDIVNYNILEIAGVMMGATTNLGQNINVATQIVSSLVGNELSTAVQGLGLAGGITMSLVLAIVVLIGTFKLFFELLKSYASIVISIVTSPVILMMGAIPGKNPFWPWLWDLLGNLSAFPAVLLVIVLFYEFTSAASGIDGGFMPPFLLARGQTGAIATLMGLALIIALPEIVKEVKKAVGAKDGIGTQIFGWAKANVQEAWKGNKYIPGAGKILGAPLKPMKTLAKGTAFVGASAATAGAGAGIGGLINRARGGTFADGAKTGAFYGALAPTGLKMAPSIIKDAWRIGKQEVGQQVAYSAVGGALDKMRQQGGVAKQVADSQYAERLLLSLRYNEAERIRRQNAAAAAGTPPTTPASAPPPPMQPQATPSHGSNPGSGTI